MDDLTLLAWAIVTVQLMIITFWLSSESIRQRCRSTPTLPPPPAAPQDNGDVVLKKRRRRLQPKSVWDMEQVSIAFERAGVKPMWVNALHTHIANHPTCSSWSDVPHLPKAAVAVLEKEFVMLTSKVTSSSVSSDGETVKLLVQLQDGLSVEAVIMTYAGNSSSDDTHPKSRATVCVSSEVGCQMGCTFCATGTMGLIAELTSGEIVEQLVHARAVKAVRNVVFMGMGEPLNNYNSVADAIRVMIHPQVFALKQRSITVSTVGVIHRLPALARDLPGVSLALSLHAPNQQLRRLIVPSAQAFKLDKLMSAVDAYTSTTGNRVFIEYVLLGPDFNCLDMHAHELGQLLHGRAVSINLIPWNPVLSPGFDFRAPPAGTACAFQSILKQYGLACTVRQEKGQDVSAACGQLVLQQQGLQSNTVKDLEDIAAGSSARASCK